MTSPAAVVSLRTVVGVFLRLNVTSSVTTATRLPGPAILASDRHALTDSMSWTLTLTVYLYGSLFYCRLCDVLHPCDSDNLLHNLAASGAARK